MNAFEVITTYLPGAIDKYFAHDSKTAVLEKGKKYIDVNFNETGYVKIASILMDGLSDYYQTQQNSENFVAPNTARPTDAEAPNYAAYAGNVASGSRDGFAIGGVDVQWEIFRLQWVRGKQFRIDYIANEETAGVIIGNALEEFHRLKVIPEVDVSRFSFMADQASASLGNLKTETIAANTIMAKFNEAFEWLFNMGVPSDQQIIFVSASTMTKIRNTTELTKFLTQGDYRSEAGIDFTVTKYMGRPIIEVPNDRFFTEALLTNNGYRATSGSKSLNYMVVSTKAVVPVRKLEHQKVYGPELSGLAGFHGYLINYLIYHGIFVPRNKVPGIYVSVSESAATAVVNTLMLDIRNNADHSWRIVNYFTNPVGMRGTIVYSAEELGNLGSSVTIDGTDVKAVKVGDVVAESAGNKAYYFGMVDATGKLIAKTNSTITVN
jgi:hypothetical protein